jgi:Glycosyl hydrolase family 26
MIRRIPRPIVVVAVLVLAVALGWAVRAALSRQSPPSTSAVGSSSAQPAVPGPGKFYLGVYSSPANLPAFDSAAAVSRPAIFGGYSGVDGNVKGVLANASTASGSIPMVSWKVDFSGNKVISGSDDTYLRAQAAAIKAYGKPVFVRLDWEMNGSWYVWGSGHVTPSAYVASWRYIWTLFHKEGVANAAFVWCPNVGELNQKSSELWYPGNGYVDWIGLDAYPDPSDPSAATKMLTGPDGLDAMADFAAAQRKPFMLAEWGPQVVNARAPQVFDLVFAWAASHPATVKALVYFDSRNDILTLDPAGAAEYRKLIREHRASLFGVGGITASTSP